MTQILVRTPVKLLRNGWSEVGGGRCDTTAFRQSRGAGCGLDVSESHENLGAHEGRNQGQTSQKEKQDLGHSEGREGRALGDRFASRGRSWSAWAWYRFRASMRAAGGFLAGVRMASEPGGTGDRSCLGRGEGVRSRGTGGRRSRRGVVRIVGSGGTARGMSRAQRAVARAQVA